MPKLLLEYILNRRYKLLKLARIVTIWIKIEEELGLNFSKFVSYKQQGGNNNLDFSQNITLICQLIDILCLMRVTRDSSTTDKLVALKFYSLKKLLQQS